MHHFDHQLSSLVRALLDRSGPLIARVNAEGSDAGEQRSRSAKEK
jgi:hypothetical protein